MSGGGPFAKRDSGFGGGSGEENGFISSGYDSGSSCGGDSDGGGSVENDSGSSEACSETGGEGSVLEDRDEVMIGEDIGGRLGVATGLTGGVGWAFCAAAAGLTVSRNRSS